MESSTKKYGGVEIPKGKRSLDLKSLPESRFSKVGGSKRKVSGETDHEDVKKKKRKIRKEVLLSSQESGAKKSRNEDDRNGTKSELYLREKSGGRSRGSNGISLALGNNESSFNIPKRPRSSNARSKQKADSKSTTESSTSNVKLKKVGADEVKVGGDEAVDRVGALKAKVSKSEYKDGPNDRLVRPVILSTGNGGVLNSRLAGEGVGSNTKSKRNVDSKFTVKSSCSNVKLKEKVGVDEAKTKKDSRSDSVQPVVKGSNLVVNNGDTSARKCRSRSRKEKDFVVGTDRVEASIRKSESAVGSSNSLFTDGDGDDGDGDEDDEENLEQNAARMLSSRFDPSCTVFSSRRKSSASQTADELSFLVTSAPNYISRRIMSLDGVESASADGSCRALRPRRGDKGKDMSKKRRHFYDVLAEDLDPYWVLKRRIKIFWPLDDSWYDGIVNDYHSKNKLHHIKYDDRDEEWVNLEEEKFKLLLLRNEVPGKAKSRKRSIGDKDLHLGPATPADDDSSTGNSFDSEPIALWLASQSQRVKALPKSSKKQKTSQKDDSKITRNNPVWDSAPANDFHACGTIDKSLLGLTSESDKHVVYVRKKYQKKNEESSSVCRYAEASGSAPQGVCLPSTKGNTVYYGSLDSDKKLWSFDDKGKSILNNGLLESKEFRFPMCLPLLPYLEFLCGVEVFSMLHDVFMLQHGVVMITSPAVSLEMLVIDSNLGLRFLSYEGCLKQALAIVFQILISFRQCDEHWNSSNKLPVMSIRFQLSGVNDLRKQHVFEIYRFSKLQRSKWLYLEAKILQHCLLIEQLSVSECTYDNIMKLQCGIFQPCKPCVGLELSSSGDFKKKFSQLATLFLNLHLQSLVEHSSARADIQHQGAMCSPEASEKGGQPVEECAHELSEVVRDFATEHEIRQLDSESPAFRGLSNYQRIGGSVFNSNPMGSENSSRRGRSRTISSPLEINSPVWSNGKPNCLPSGFSNGPKKPRTQVQYTLPFEGYDFSRKQEMLSAGSLPCKRIRRASLRRISDGSGNNQKNLELLTCSANVLVTNEVKGWRECGAHIVLEVAGDNEWRLAVKLSGVTKFSNKVKHILQPGSTNRYSHAMIWKGGKDWVLEFPDRSQWMLFKEMYEECYNRNIRAAAVKNIPIPGVRVVDENDDYGDEVPFARNSTMYFRQVQTDAEMAMDPSHILYDMDSDDEQWLMACKNCADKHKYEQISEEFLEMAMDMFEKVSYAQRRDNFTDAEIEELAIGTGSMEAAKLIYQHWRQKREKMRMPLIRHFQPPPWERYERQLKEWEQNFGHGNCGGGQEKEKPPMFAFCFKPRGLDVPNKGSKQRSHRKLSVSGKFHAFSGNRNNPLVLGRRPNGHAFVDDKVLYTSTIHEFSDDSPSLHSSARVWSPRDAHCSLTPEWKVYRKLYKNKPRKIRHPYFHTHRAMPHNRSTTRTRIGAQLWNNLKQLDISDLHEFHLRDALGAAQHARNMAKFKKQKAQSLMYKADLAIHKAVATLMNAEAVKDSFENSSARELEQRSV